MLELFNNYVKQFDFKLDGIKYKYHHSFRVADIAKNIAISLNFNKDDIELAYNCGLLHDIGRFKQYTLYNTFKDEDSFDHGDIGSDILNELINDDNNKEIILLSTKYHNKYCLPNLNDRIKLFCNIVRDADKLDIMREQCNTMNDQEIIIKDVLINNIYDNVICKNKDVSTNTDHIINMLSWINDFNFNYSYQYLLDNNILENKFNLLNLYGKREDVIKLKEFIYDKINNILGGNYGK